MATLYLYNKIGATIYNADQVIGKTLYMNAGKSINVRKLPSITSEVITVAKSSEYVGVVYSYVTKSDGIWWQLDRGNVVCWVKHAEGYFDVQALSSQGALTPEEIAARKAESEKTFGDKILDKVFSLGKIGLIILGCYLGAKAILSK